MALDRPLLVTAKTADDWTDWPRRALALASFRDVSRTLALCPLVLCWSPGSSERFRQNDPFFGGDH